MMGKMEEGSAVGTVVHGYTKVVGKYNSAVCIVAAWPFRCFALSSSLFIAFLSEKKVKKQQLYHF